MPKVSDILKEIKDTDIKFVDLRFTDPRGKLQHVTMDASVMDSDARGSGHVRWVIDCWRKAINESDMINARSRYCAHRPVLCSQQWNFQIFGSYIG